ATSGTGGASGTAGEAGTGGTGGAGGSGGFQEGAPVIERFRVEPRGVLVGAGSAALSWEVTGADSLRIDEGVGTVTGSTTSINVTETTTFTLTATNGNGTTTKATTILVALDGPLPFERSGVQTSIGLIDAALQNGDIDDVTALRYKVFALFADERLPPELDADGAIHGSPIMRELARRFSGLPAETQDELRPFMRSPEEPGSWFESGSPQTRQKGAEDFDLAEVADGAIRVVWSTDLTITERILIDEVLVPAVEGAYEDLLFLMDRTLIPHFDGQPYRVYIVNRPGRGDLGWTTPEGFSSSFEGTRSHVTVNLAQTGSAETKLTAATVAHELMHAFQFAFDSSQSGAAETKALDWLGESTATWAEHFVFPTYNTEHGYAACFIPHVLQPLDEPPAKNAQPANCDETYIYGGYLFHLFVDEEYGFDRIRLMWENTEAGDAIEAVDQALDGELDKAWPRFMAANWNADEVDFFQRWDGMDKSSVKDEASPPFESKVSGKQQTLVFALDDLNGVGVDYLSARYFYIDLTDPSVRTVVFANGFTFELDDEPVPFVIGDQTLSATPLSMEEREGRHVQLLVKADGEWLPEPFDVSDVAFVPFCQDYAEERVEEVVFIFSNSRWLKSIRAAVDAKNEQPRLFVSNVSCGDWVGSASAQTIDISPDETETTNVSFDGLRFTRDRLSREALLQGAGETKLQNTILPADVSSTVLDRYRLDNVEVNWSVSGMRSGVDSCSISGMGQLTEDDLLGLPSGPGISQFEMRPSLVGETAEPLSIYRSFFLNVAFLAPGTPIVETCSQSGVSMRGFMTGIIGGRRNLPEFGLQEVSSSGNAISAMWSTDETTYQLNLMGASDP
ncbi:MAG: hypothetical protein WBG86_18580, partial [Polyangiales bacterium]